MDFFRGGIMMQHYVVTYGTKLFSMTSSKNSNQAGYYQNFLMALLYTKHSWNHNIVNTIISNRSFGNSELFNQYSIAFKQD